MEMELKKISGIECKCKCKRQALESNGNGMEKNSLNGNGKVTIRFHSMPVPAIIY